MRSLTIFGPRDPVLAWDGTQLFTDCDLTRGARPSPPLDGICAAVQPLPDGGTRIVRDRLGLGKLFWARGVGGRVEFAARTAQLTAAGHRLDTIMSVPRGVVLEYDRDGCLIGESRFHPPRAQDLPPAPVSHAGRRIRRTLDAYLAALAERYRDRRIYVCLSGGLDSSTVAAVAREHFPDLTGVSFDLAEEGSAPSEDRLAAIRLAGDLGLPLLEANASPERLLSHLDEVLVEGIDWRDFNVHCALVNAVLGEAIAREHGRDGPAPLVITGDLPNQFLVDYHAETYGGATYYALPRLGAERLRSILIDGLDSCHREGGPFGAHGLVTVQPYAACLEDYLSLPADFLDRPDRKDVLVRQIVGSALPRYIYERPKVRAQIGGEQGGVLATCIDRGIDGPYLRRRFAELHDLDDDAVLDRFLRAGRYRSQTPSLAEEIHADA